MGTTRKKAEGFPFWLQNHIDNNNELLWDSTLAEVIDENTLCFIWQDNITVCAISTAHSLYRSEDKIQRKRRCPKITSENRRILQPVFNGLAFKELFIPRAINDYNHHMKGVDQANQLRASFICHRKQKYRTWWPLISFFIDIAGVNSYLLWKWSSSINAANATGTHNSHRSFLNALYKQLLHSNDKERHKKQQATEEPKNEDPNTPRPQSLILTTGTYKKSSTVGANGEKPIHLVLAKGLPKSANLGPTSQNRPSTALAIIFQVVLRPITNVADARFGYVSREAAGNSITTQLKHVTR
jgi:Transposase IS4